MNRVVHFEIHASDLDKVTQFYTDVFGWKVEDMGPAMGNYRMVTTGADDPSDTWRGINGGITPRVGKPPMGDEAVNAFVCTISVDDVDAYIEKVQKAGGTIAIEKMDVPKVGMLVYGKDIEGNLFGMLQPSPM